MFNLFRSSRRLKLLGAYLGVVCLQLLILYPLHRVIDLPSWDESNYLGSGGAFAVGSAKLPALDLSPFYAFCYTILIRIVGTMNSTYAMRYLLTSAVSILLLKFLHRQTASLRIATFLTTVWVIADYNVGDLNEFPLIYRCGLVLFLMALLQVNKNRLGVLFWLALATLVRMEYAVILGGYGLYAVWGCWRQRPAWRSLRSPSLLVGASLFFWTLFNMETWRIGGSRSWLAFMQHYALGHVALGRAEINPWAQYGMFIAQDFPDSYSISDALQTNFSAFAGHIVRNFAQFIPQFYRLIQPTDVISGLLTVWVLGLMIGVVIFCALQLDSGALRARWGEVRGNSADFPLLATLSALTVFSTLLIYAKPEYALPLHPFLFLSLGLIIKVVWAGIAATAARDKLSHHAIPVLLALATVVIALSAVAAQPLIPTDYPDSAFPRRATITRLDQLWPTAQRVAFLGVGASSYCNYLGLERCEPIEPLFARQQLGAIDLRETPYDAILLNTDFVRLPDLNVESLAVLASADYQLLQTGSDQIYLRNSAEFPPLIPHLSDTPIDFPTYTPELNLSLGYGWYPYQAPFNVRWMRSPGQLFIHANSATTATLTLNPSIMKITGGNMGGEGDLSLTLNQTPLTTLTVVSDGTYPITLPLKTGWNQLDLSLAAGNAIPSLQDPRALSIAFKPSQLSIITTP